MTERQLWRALYKGERDTFVVEQAGWVNGEPRIEYRFCYFSADEDAEIAFLGGLDKRWLDEDGFAEHEFFAFGKYSNEAAFDSEVERILQEAAQVTQDENLDNFLAVIDMVKQQAVDAQLENEALFNWEGLFDGGDEDAYSLHPYDSTRLHDHVVRTRDECWRLYVARVLDPQQKMLGWSVCSVLYPDLTSEATSGDIDTTQAAYILDLNHFHTYGEAVISINGTLLFMFEGDRVEDPEYAYMDDSLVLELLSLQSSVEGIVAPEWQMLDSDKLHRFLKGNYPLVRAPEHWHPRQDDVVAYVAEEMQLPVHVADQLYAHLLASMKASEPFDEDSPWRIINDLE